MRVPRTPSAPAQPFFVLFCSLSCFDGILSLLFPISSSSRGVSFGHVYSRGSSGGSSVGTEAEEARSDGPHSSDWGDDSDVDDYEDDDFDGDDDDNSDHNGDNRHGEAQEAAGGSGTGVRGATTSGAGHYGDGGIEEELQEEEEALMLAQGDEGGDGEEDILFDAEGSEVSQYIAI